MIYDLTKRDGLGNMGEVRGGVWICVCLCVCLCLFSACAWYHTVGSTTDY